MTKDELLEHIHLLSDDDILDEAKERDILPEPEYGCDCEPEDGFRVNTDQKYSLLQAIGILENSGYKTDSNILNDLLEELS